MHKLLDPVSLNIAVRRAFGGLDRGASLAVFAIALLFALATGFIWWHYDLMSTWMFMQGAQADTSSTITDVVVYTAQGDPNLALIIGGLVGVAFTLAPSLVEFLAPRVVHPGAQMALNISILFDFVTDWPTAYGLIMRWNERPGGWLGELFFTFMLTLALSLFVQVLFVLALTALIVSAVNIVTGRASGAQYTVDAH